MEHEILFRGKPMFREIDEFVYGYYKQGDIAGVKTDFILPLPEYKNEINEVAVCPMTVGQYTGLTDKNGTKIFEGDICDFVVFDCFDNDTQYRGIVVYDGSRFMLWKSVESEYYGANGGFDLDWVIAQYDEFEVVGNIHDDLKLLKGEKNGR